MNNKILIRYESKLPNKFILGNFYNISLDKEKVSYKYLLKDIDAEKFIDDNNGLLVNAEYVGRSKADAKLMFIVDIISVNRDRKLKNILE